MNPGLLEDLNVLVVEDHYVVAAELAQLLRQLGATVVGPLARVPPKEWMEGRDIDVALLDVQLRRGTSLPLADDMARRGVPVALVTGYGRHDLPPPYQDLPRLDKPVERHALAAAVLKLAGRIGDAFT